jgi:chemotaxis protein methyltransferase CheR
MPAPAPAKANAERRAIAPGSAPVPDPPLEDLELNLLLEAVFQFYGFDFRDYAPSSLRRRIRHLLRDEGLATISALQDRVLHEAAALPRLVQSLSVSVTSMYRDPGFFRAFRQRVVPVLRTYPMVRIWHAGCSTGEEVYSMAALLLEEGLYDRCRIYATDMNEVALQKAAAGAFPLAAMREHTARYMAAGGRRSFSEYYSVRDRDAVFDRRLRRNVVFAQHNLVTDRSFNEFNAILSRNVLIYFNRSLQERVHRLLYESLGRLGFLGLGSKETVQFTPFERSYQVIDPVHKIYRKVG